MKCVKVTFLLDLDTRYLQDERSKKGIFFYCLSKGDDLIIGLHIKCIDGCPGLELAHPIDHLMKGHFEHFASWCRYEVYITNKSCN